MAQFVYGSAGRQTLPSAGRHGGQTIDTCSSTDRCRNSRKWSNGAWPFHSGFMRADGRRMAGPSRRPVARIGVLMSLWQH